jgi:Glycosyl transferase family 2
MSRRGRLVGRRRKFAPVSGSLTIARHDPWEGWHGHGVVMREKLSVFVIAYNRASLLETCLRAVSFADEVIVVDKSSTDGTAAVAARYASRVETVPWSPTVEETRAFALSLCRHPWVLCLDDDEVMSPASGPALRRIIAETKADILDVPLRHYILGVHDERAYYWPEAHRRLFRADAIRFGPTVHGGTMPRSDRVASIPIDSGVCIHHLSHPDVASWIERTNRYTSRSDRGRVIGGEGDLIGFAHDRLNFWMDRTADSAPDGYPAAVAVLRAIYDMVDRLKTWEETRGLDGAALLRMVQRTLQEGRDPTDLLGGGDQSGQPRAWREFPIPIPARDADRVMHPPTASPA